MGDRILMVDDDETILTKLSKAITLAGMDSDAASSREDALEKILHGNYSLMMLDSDIQGMDSFDMIEELRRRGNKLPIIVVGRRNEYDALYCFKIGADDYIVKPFNPVIMAAKIKALIRRSSGNLAENSNMLFAGPFTYNTSTMRLYKNGNEIALTGKENSLMKLFLDNVNHIFSKNALYDFVWGGDIVGDNTIMVHIRKLRQKIEDDPEHPKYIQTVRGIGYRFVV